MKRWYFAWAAVVLLVFAVPLFAQEIDIEDEEIITLVAAAGPDNPPVLPGDRKGNVQPGATPSPGGFQGAYGPGYGRWGGGPGSYLNFSRDQIAKMRDLWNRYYADTRNLRYDLMQKRIEMRRLFTDPKADSAAIAAKQKEVSAIRQKLVDRRAQAMIEWRGLLTPEQIQKLDTFSMGHRGMGGGMGMGSGMGQGMGCDMMGRGW
ncbi:MAG: zinc resistance protein [Syntrophorhabdaceae bacterium PtaU1.Bin034]|nr:MAG: zinc resistance protein [Syntrophorhabdaceae bacterium PtaU1.Bin034]